MSDQNLALQPDVDSISESDFDFLCDSALNLALETSELTSADEVTLNKIRDHLHSDKYSLSLEVNAVTTSWWDDEELPSLLDEDSDDAVAAEAAADATAEAAASAADASSASACAQDSCGCRADDITLEVNIISTVDAGSHAGERVVVASVHFDVPASLTDIQDRPLKNIAIKWLPELDN